MACVTKPYLIRLFKREFGTSPVQFINKKKMERAQLLLFTTEMPVKEKENGHRGQLSVQNGGAALFCSAIVCGMRII